MIEVFKRAAWKKNADWPEGWEPWGSAPRRHVCYVDSIEQARDICRSENEARTSRGDVFHEFKEVH